MPAPDQAQGQAAQAQSQMGQMIQNVGQGLGLIAKVSSKMPLPEGAAEEIQQIAQAYGDWVGKLSGQGQEQPPQGPQTVSPEQGGNAQAMPAGMMSRG